ncbi:hypothetical protein WMW71_08880 [Flavobacterium buctense]|uniref:Peptidase M56 domain-containing protein n=1 Tax=Flavobacterium buctense TaxID=1648146 RepID=A0ABU9E4E9_9FLAO|nr:hypothetical protein [Flavobacterium buctense]
MILIVSKYLIPKGYRGLTVFPFVVLKSSQNKSDSVLINHEKIHLRQQLELMILPFFIWYGLEFLLRLLKHKDRQLAYRMISFEQEAYGNEKDLYYLKQRSFWSFLKYL